MELSTRLSSQEILRGKIIKSCNPADMNYILFQKLKNIFTSYSFFQFACSSGRKFL